jgi:hypothetical protein
VDMATIDDESQYYQQGREAFVAHYVMWPEKYFPPGILKKKKKSPNLLQSWEKYQIPTGWNI